MNVFKEALKPKLDKTYLSKQEVVDNLTTDDSAKALSAKQGKILKDMIGDAISYINQ